MKPFIVSLLIIVISTTSTAQPVTGKPGPDIALPDSNGRIFNLQELRGKVVLIDFWASWCAPCRKNNPRLAKIYAQLHAQGFEILGISIDRSLKSWKEAIREDQLGWIQVIDMKGLESAETYQVNSIPSSFLLDKEGIIIHINPEGRMLENEIRKLLKKT